jgi:ABC-type transport system substrate-binding protein
MVLRGKKRNFMGLGLLITLILLSACVKDKGSSAANPTATVSTATATGSAVTASVSPAKSSEGKSKVLRVRFYDDPAGFDPATIFRVENESIAFNIFSGLTSYDSKGTIIPDLAESWSTDDNITWTFKLRKGVQWQQGYGEFTSADVLYSYERILDPKTASPYASEFKNMESFKAPDAYTVVIKLKKADGNFLHQVAKQLKSWETNLCGTRLVPGLIESRV